jgi:hypothetical protein
MPGLISRLSYANVVATLALFVALGGGAYAAATLPRNSVGRVQIKRDAVNSVRVADGSLTAKDFKAGQLPAGPQGPKGDPGAPGAAGAQGPKGDTGAPGSAASNVQLAHVDTSSPGTGYYSGIGAAIGVSSAGTVTDVVSLETANRAFSTRTPVAIVASDLSVSGDSELRDVTVSVKEVDVAQPFLQCTIPAGKSTCESTGSANVPAGTRLIISISSPSNGKILGADALAIGWRARPA